MLIAPDSARPPPGAPPASRVLLVLGLYCAVAGVLSVLAWVADLPRLANWDAGAISIQPNTGLAAVAAGGALLLLALDARRAAAALGGLAALIGASALFQTLSGVDLGIDTPLMFDRPWGRHATVAPGRMGPPAAVSWVLAGAALVLQRGPSRLRRAASVLGLVVTAIAALSLTGYLFGADPLYSLPRLTAIAFQTSTMLLALGLGLVAMIPERQPMSRLLEDSAAGVLTRRTLPFIIVVPLVLGFLRVRGEQARLYDAPMGTAMLVLALVGLLGAVLWWSAAAVRRHELAFEAAAEQSRRDIARSEERYRSLVSVITDVPWTADPSGAIVAPQPAWAAYTGQSWEAMRGVGWFDALHPDDRAPIAEQWATARRTGAVYRATGRLWHAATRTYRHVAARAMPLWNPDGTVREWVGTCTDVHEERRAAAEREALLTLAERARAEAERANRAKDEFLAVLSHELRSPLNAMLGWVRILRRAGTGDAMVARAVETLERNIWTQAQVIDDLLDISRITSGRLELERTRVDVAAVVAGCVESIRPMAAGKQLGLACELADGRLEVDGDATRLNQVVGNVLNNAVKFTPEGGRVSVRLRRRDGDAVIEVEDTGPGIDPALLPHVFDRFVQSASSTTRRHGGLGLGLAIVKQLTALHGGSVRAESAGPGRGARFTVTLPLASPEARERAAPARRAASGPPVDAAALDVLLVEDDADSREALGMAFAESGVRVRAVASVRQAVDAYAARPPDVLVSDIAMPDEDGYALIRAIREREEGSSRRTLAIAMTGFASRHDHETALRAGFDDHVGKPVEVETLLERMRVLVASRGRPDVERRG